MKTTVKNKEGFSFSVDFSISSNINYLRRTGDYGMDYADHRDWDWFFDEIVCLETGHTEDEDAVTPEMREQLLAYWKDNYDLTPTE